MGRKRLNYAKLQCGWKAKLSEGMWYSWGLGSGSCFNIWNVLTNWHFRDDMDDYISSGAKSTSGVWLEKVTGMTTAMKFIFKKFLLTCSRCGSIRINVRRVLIVSLMLLMWWIIMPYLQSLFCIVWQVPLFPFYRCISRGTERFRHVFKVAYRVSSGDILEP